MPWYPFCGWATEWGGREPAKPCLRPEPEPGAPPYASGMDSAADGIGFRFRPPLMVSTHRAAFRLAPGPEAGDRRAGFRRGRRDHGRERTARDEGGGPTGRAQAGGGG